MKDEKLAVEGGAPFIGEELPSWPWFTDEIIEAAMQPLKTGKVNYWTGSCGMEFEKAFAAWNGSKFAISTTNGTSALHVALAGLNIGPGDEVITSPYTFIASSFSIVQAGAIPVFADVCRETHCIDPADIEKKITGKTRAIIPVHLYGNVSEMDEIMRIAGEHDLYVIEDAAEAHGATYNGKKVGTIGHAGAFSFCQNKTFTTGGEGGMVVTDREDTAWNCRSFRDHGYDVEKRMSLLDLEGALPYIHTRIGYNYRMTEMQSAIGLKEMERLDSWNLPRRRKNGELLISELTGCEQILTLPVHDEKIQNGFYVFPIVLNLDTLTCDKKTFLDAVTAEGVPAWREFWPQSYREKAYQEHNGFGRFKFPFRSAEYTSPESVRYDAVFCENAAWLEERTFIIHCFPTLEEKHVRAIAGAVKKVAKHYAK